MFLSAVQPTKIVAKNLMWAVSVNKPYVWQQMTAKTTTNTEIKGTESGCECVQ